MNAVGTAYFWRARFCSPPSDMPTACPQMSHLCRGNTSKLADHTDLGTISWLCPFQIQALYAHAALMTLDYISQYVLLPESSSSESQHNVLLGQKIVLLQGPTFPCAYKPVAKSAKWGVEMGERKARHIVLVHPPKLAMPPEVWSDGRSWPSLHIHIRTQVWELFA